MVLEDVGNSAPGSSNDNPYPSSDDPYASASSSSSARFDSSSFPQPVPIIGPLLGFSESTVREKVELTIALSERKIGRVLFPHEAQALASHLYQMEQTSSYYTAYGATAGAYRCWSTAAQMRFPFYKPDIEKIDRNKFGPIKGPWAMMARHSCRFVLYAAAASHFGNLIGRVLTQPKATREMANDTKLELFVTELKAAATDGPLSTAQQAWEVLQSKRKFETEVKNRSGGGPSPQASWGRQSAKENSEEDMSPTAGNEAWGSQSPATESWETFSKDSSQPAPRKENSSLPRDNWSNRQPQASRQSQASSLPFDDDDASPTGGLFQDEVNSSHPKSEPQSRSGESTWERLRRGGAPVPIQRAPPQSRRAESNRVEQRDESVMGDSYNIDQGEEDRKRTKEQAQQEFDARLERERQGRDFSSGDEKRW